MPNFEDLANKKIEDLSDILKQKGFIVSNSQKGQFNFQVDISSKSESVKLLVYYGKKGNKLVLQGNNQSKLFKEINDIVFGEKLFTEDTIELNEPDIYIGTDESGKGDYFGPLVVSAVFTNRVITKKLRSIGVRDSKELTEQMISIIANKIKQIDGFVSDVIVINPEKYNLLYNKFRNLNKMLGWAHAKALENILEIKSAPEAISDKFGNEKYIHDSLQQKGRDLKLHQVTKAERYTAVAAASILARDSFNYWFYKMKNKLNYDLPKGASNLVETKAKEIISQFGKSELEKIAKLHFKTTKKL